MIFFLALLPLGADPAMPGKADQVATSFTTSNVSLESTARPSPIDCTSESANFVIRTHGSGPNAAEFIRNCEKVRTELQSELIGSVNSAEWRPKCEIILHRTRARYLEAVGTAGSQTTGSAAIGLSKGRVTKRRIDLLAEVDSETISALKHELVHVLFVDRFPTRVPPKWAEEGLALLSDSEEKQNRHRVDYRHAKQTRTLIPLDTLLCCENYPPGCHRPAFYGQSHAIVDYLIRRESPKRFMDFVELAMETNPNAALNAVYGIQSTSHLAEILRSE